MLDSQMPRNSQRDKCEKLISSDEKKIIELEAKIDTLKKVVDVACRAAGFRDENITNKGLIWATTPHVTMNELEHAIAKYKQSQRGKS